MKKIFSINGMYCNSCANKIESELKNDVKKISVSYSKGNAEIDFDEDKISEKEIKERIKKVGYEVIEEKIRKSSQKNIGWMIVTISSLLLIFIAYNIFSDFGFSFPSLDEKTSFALLFLAGLLTGFHCIAMCGGFLLSYTAKNAVEGYKSFAQHLVYGASKTISYTIIGGIFGLVGSLFFFSPQLRGGIAIFAGIFMMFYSLSIFGVGFFRKFQFSLKFLNKISTKKYSGFYFGPMITGLLNGLFITCGPLQAWYIYAAGTGSFVEGGLSLMVFGLGTLPMMLGFGGIASALSKNATAKILKISAIIVLILGLIMLNRGMALTGSGYDFKSLADKIRGDEINNSNVYIENGYQIIKMDVDGEGWHPDSFVLKKNVPVKWIINGKEITNCNKAIQVPKLGLKFDIKSGEQTIEFTPTEEGVISWSCWMGMIPGTFIVTETGEATQTEINSASENSAPSGSGSCGAGGCGGSCGMNNGKGCGCGN